MARHPNRARLDAWLDGAEHDIDEHVENCEHCVETLTSISAETTEPKNKSELKPALLQLLQPPDDLHERMSQRLAERLQRRQDLEVLGSMLGVPKETGSVYMGSEDATAGTQPKPESPRLVSDNTDDPPGDNKEG